MIPDKILDIVVEINSKLLKAEIKRQFNEHEHYMAFFNHTNIMSINKKDGKWFVCLEPENFEEYKGLLNTYPYKIKHDPFVVELEVGEG